MTRTWQLCLLIGLLLGVLGLGLYHDFDIQWSDFGTADWLAYWSFSNGLFFGQGYGNPDWLLATQAAAGYQTVYLGESVIPIWRVWNPPPLLIPLLPLGALGFTAATLIWLFFSVALPFHAASLLNRWLAAPLPPLALLGLLLSFWPLYLALYVGQLSPVLVAFIIYAWLAYDRGHQVAAGLLLALTLLKVHLFVLPITLLLWVALRQRHWLTLFSFGLTLLAFVSIMFMLDAGWVATYLTNGAPTNWQTFTPLDILVGAFDLPPWAQTVGLPLGGLLALWRYRLVGRLTPWLLGEGVLFSMLLSPYTGHYDLFALFPAALWIAHIMWQRGLFWLYLLLALLNTQLFVSYKLIRTWLGLFIFIFLWLWSLQYRLNQEEAMTVQNMKLDAI